jgi:hypothetical protein
VLCEKAIVVLSNEETRNDFITHISELPVSELERHFGEVEVCRAPEPKEIMWENINNHNKKRVVRLVVGWLLTAALIVVVTGIFYGILNVKGNVIYN